MPEVVIRQKYIISKNRVVKKTLKFYDTKALKTKKYPMHTHRILISKNRLD